MIGLHIDSVRKQFAGTQVLNDVFMLCLPGDIIGLLGRNGSGKSTLLKIVLGTLKADQKFVRVDGEMADSLFKNAGRIGYLSQDHFLPNHLKIKSLVSCFCARNEVSNVLNNEFLRPLLHKKSSQLSGGERRVLEILMLLHSGAKYLLLDEPFNGIAPIYIEVIKEMIKEQGGKKGIVITDHDYKNVLAISSKIILMDNGNTRAIKEVNELVSFGYLPASSRR